MRQLFRQAALDELNNVDGDERSLVLPPARPILFFLALALVSGFLLLWALTGSIPHTVDAYGLLVQNPGYTRVTIPSPSDGTINEILVGTDERIEIGQIIARLEMADGIIEVTSPYAGTIIRVNVRRGEDVRASTALLSMRSDLETSGSAPLEAVLYLPYEQAQMVFAGMKAYVVPSGISTLRYGYMTGTVLSVSQTPSTDPFARGIAPNAPLVSVRVGLDGDPSGIYEWTLNQQPDIALRAGMQLVGKVLIEEEQPITRLLRLSQDAR